MSSGSGAVLKGTFAVRVNYVGSVDVYPSYYVYQMYKKFGNELVYSSSDDSELSIYAAGRNDGSLTVMIVNLALEEKTKAIRIEGQAHIQAEAWLFDPTHKAENIGMIEITNSTIVPAQSLMLYIILGSRKTPIF